MKRLREASVDSSRWFHFHLHEMPLKVACILGPINMIITCSNSTRKNFFKKLRFLKRFLHELRWTLRTKKILHLNRLLQPFFLFHPIFTVSFLTYFVPHLIVRQTTMTLFLANKMELPWRFSFRGNYGGRSFLQTWTSEMNISQCSFSKAFLFFLQAAF
mgnify:CR=1 FL=1